MLFRKMSGTLAALASVFVLPFSRMSSADPPLRRDWKPTIAFAGFHCLDSTAPYALPSMDDCDRVSEVGSRHDRRGKTAAARLVAILLSFRIETPKQLRAQFRAEPCWQRRALNQFAVVLLVLPVTQGFAFIHNFTTFRPFPSYCAASESVHQGLCSDLG
jgi:hypothetical protein